MLFPSFHHQNISLSTPCKHLFIRESSWRPQNISLQSFWHITRFQHDQKMRHFWLISAAHRPLIDQDDLIGPVMHCDALWCTVMHCDAVSKRPPANVNVWCAIHNVHCVQYTMCNCAICNTVSKRRPTDAMCDVQYTICNPQCTLGKLSKTF